MKVDLRKSLFILPNLFTLSSVLCGYYAILTCASPEATGDDFYRASLLIIFAMFFDTIDGRVARLTKTQSAIGVQLDSLADVISFGVAPAVLVFRWSLDRFETLGMFVCFVYIACGTIRLARFNVLTMGEAGAPKKPGKYIVGLPIPAAAGILISLVVANTVARQTALRDVLGAPSLILGVVAALSFFMVSTIKFRSFKDIKLNRRTMAFIAIAIGSTVFVARRYHISFALVWLLACYIAIALAESLLRIGRSVRRRRGEHKEAS
ncbi:MAG: CDP-diacylglycerol--serine O-phosphatidyltransferase [Myxococcota bacterium]